MLPVNAPKCAHHNNHHDGVMNFMQRSEEVSSLCAHAFVVPHGVMNFMQRSEGLG